MRVNGSLAEANDGQVLRPESMNSDTRETLTPRSTCTPAIHRNVWVGILSIIVATSTVQADSHADDAATVADVVIGAQLSTSTDSNQRTKASLLMIYYLGRIDGRSPDFDLQKYITEESSPRSVADFKSEVLRCSNALAKKGEQMIQVGKYLTQEGK
jgi:hypothetical protein